MSFLLFLAEILRTRKVVAILICLLLINLIVSTCTCSFPAISARSSGSSDKNQAGLSIGLPPKESSGSRSLSQYTQAQQVEKKINLIAYPVDTDEVYTDDNVTIQFLIINTLDNTVKIERLESEYPNNFTFISCNPPKGMTYRRTNNVLYTESSGPSGISGSSYIYCDYKIKPRVPGNYVLKPAILRYSNSGSSTNVSSDMVYIKVKNRYVEVNNFSIMPSPVVEGDSVILKAEMIDPDRNDTIQWELLSNINGLICKSQNKSNRNTTNFSFPTQKLSMGDHIITLKVHDNHNDFVERQLMLKVMRPWYKEYLAAFGIVTIIAICNLINTLDPNRKILGKIWVYLLNTLYLHGRILRTIWLRWLFRATHSEDDLKSQEHVQLTDDKD